MARYAPLWQQAGNYSAQVDRQLFAALWPTGGADGAPITAQVNTLNVNVPAGRCAVPMTTDGSAALCRWDATEVVTLNAGPGAGTSRIDLIVVMVRDAAISGTNNDFIITVLTGTPAAAPVPPNMTANSYALVSVLVPASVANLNTATITKLAMPLSAAIPHTAGAVNRGGALSWIQGGWSNWPPGVPPYALSIPFTKYRADTVLKVFAATTCYAGVVTNGAQLGFRIGTGADQSLAGFWVPANTRATLAGQLVVANVPAGALSVNMRASWPGTGASDSLNFSTNEFATMTVTEEYA
jgi:hypothetical protein